ncbi:hypothetical protein [Metabacillus sp. FJAT-53654]|uniref:Uncharacterized protein n=1 Tax=Metabacillus rhizosphaerae TaxID=3117747 RepID=A0ABZ2MNX8_9BACI
MSGKNGTWKNVKLSFNNWLDRRIIKPAIEDFGTQVYTARNRIKFVVKLLFITLAVLVIFSMFISIGIYMWNNWSEWQSQDSTTSKETQSVSTKELENTKAEEKMKKNEITTTTTDTKTIITETNGTTKEENITKNETITKPVTETEPKIEAPSPTTITDLVIKTFEKNSLFKIIFSHLLILFIIFIVFQILLAMMGELRRFKVGNIEVESKASGTAVLQTINQMTTKFDILIFWLNSSSLEEFNSYLVDKSTQKEYIEVILGLMKSDYFKEWGINFDYDVFPRKQLKRRKYPMHIRRSVDILDRDPRGIAINKDDTARLFEMNYLVYKVKVAEVNSVGESIPEEYVIVLNSHKHQFDENDVQLLDGMCSLIQIVYARNYIAGELILSQETAISLQEQFDSVDDMQTKVQKYETYRGEMY